jgi:hypothetical protein
MIPTTTEVFAAFPFLAKLHGLQELPDAGGVAAALEEAQTVATRRRPCSLPSRVAHMCSEPGGPR